MLKLPFVVLVVGKLTKKGRTYVDFIEEVAARGICDNGVYIFEDQKAGRHIPSLLEDTSDTPCACCGLDIETGNGEPIASEKRVHQRLDRDCLPVSCWAYAVIAVSFPIHEGDTPNDN